MRVVTVAGTRPEIIRLSRIIPLLDRFSEHTFVHTGQNDAPLLRDVFFKDLKLREPDIQLQVRRDGLAPQLGAVMSLVGAMLTDLRPDRLVILGDTDSALCALVAARLGVPVLHLEAGNRCFDDRVPEEINRRVIDQVSTVLMPYTHRSKENLLAEGFPRHRIFVVGNPIGEILAGLGDPVDDVAARLGAGERFVLLSLHRAETVDHPDRLRMALAGVAMVASELGARVVFPVHPRTRRRLETAVDSDRRAFVFTDPLGIVDFVSLQKRAELVFTDSGTVQEEATILHRPSVILREVNERAETLEAGSTVLAGISPQGICSAARIALGTPTTWSVPDEYLARNVAETVVRIALGELPGVATPSSARQV